MNINSTDWNNTAGNIAAGSTKSIWIDLTTACTSGNKYSYPKEGIQIDYNTANINNKTQKALADIVGTC